MLQFAGLRNARLLSPWIAAGTVNDPEDHDLVVPNGVMDQVRIAHEGNAADAGPSCHFLNTSRELTDPLDDTADPSFEPHRCIHIARLNGCGNRVEFGQCQTRITDLHVRRQLANTASTSSSFP